MPNPAPLPATVDHLVIGAGFAGIGAAIKLDEAGERDWVVVEKDADVGGTWWANSYPGAACDVPSQLYSFSFAPNPDWSHSFSPQGEILDYLRRVAREHGILDRVHLDTAVEEATWDEDAQRWRVRTSRGEVVARHVICGAGSLSEPKLPDIDGIETFAGPVFHSARWDHDVDLAGKRVAIIGTGASAIQIIPELQKVVGHLDVHQRTAPYVIPRLDRRYSRAEKALFRWVPGLRKAYRAGIYWARETYVPAFTRWHFLTMPSQLQARRNLEKAVSDPELRAKLTPTFDMGCKRVLISSTYYPALASDNVDVITDRITRVTPAGIVTTAADGSEVERPLDVLVVATGFHAADPPIAERIVGRDGHRLSEVWAKEGMASYKGTATHGFPNFFQIVGANTILGHSSMVFMIECQLRYLVEALQTMRVNRYGAVEVRRDVQDAWNDDLQRRLERTVWNRGGCSSWYLDGHGRNTVVWPRATYTFRRELEHFDVDAYVVEPTR
jgi:cyclohexanone monooxygenase